MRSIAAVADGQVIFSPEVGTRLIASNLGPGPAGQVVPFPTMTAREQQILDRMARGVRNDAIALRMGISLKTVQNTVSTILLKLGASDRERAVELARAAGLGRPG